MGGPRRHRRPRRVPSGLDACGRARWEPLQEHGAARPRGRHEAASSVVRTFQYVTAPRHAPLPPITTRSASGHTGGGERCSDRALRSDTRDRLRYLRRGPWGMLLRIAAAGRRARCLPRGGGRTARATSSLLMLAAPTTGRCSSRRARPGGHPRDDRSEARRPLSVKPGSRTFHPGPASAATTDAAHRYPGKRLVAGVNGDLFAWDDGRPTGTLAGRRVYHPPSSERSSIGFVADGALRRAGGTFGTYRGTGQRRLLDLQPTGRRRTASR